VGVGVRLDPQRRRAILPRRHGAGQAADRVAGAGRDLRRPVWLLREAFPARLLAGVAVSFGSAVVVGLSESRGGRASVVGVLLCLAAAASYAVAVVCQKAALRHASAQQVTTFACLTGTAACLPFAGQLASEAARAPRRSRLSRKPGCAICPPVSTIMKRRRRPPDLRWCWMRPQAGPARAVVRQRIHFGPEIQ
jgi:EamA-like transporter family